MQHLPSRTQAWSSIARWIAGCVALTWQPARVDVMRWYACALWLLPACSSGSTFIPLPDLESSIRSWLLVQLYGDGAVEVYAADREAPVTLVSHADTPERVELRGFEASLAELELTPGVVLPDPSAPYTRALPRGDVVLAAEREGDVLAAWLASSPDLRADDFRYAVSTPCAPLIAELAELPLSGSVRWAVSVDGDAAYLGTQDGVAVIRRGTEPELLPWARSVGEPAPVVYSAWLDARGRLWMGDEEGGLWVASVAPDGLRATRIVGPFVGRRVVALAGNPEDPEGELYGATREGLVYRLAGDRWTVVHDLEVVERRQDVVIVWLGPGELLAGARVRRTLLHLREGLAPRELGDFPLGVTALARLDPSEVLVAVGAGQVTRFVEGALEPTEQSAIALDILAFAPYASGYLYAGASGYVGQWLPAAGFCPVPTAALAPRTVSQLVRLGDELVALGDNRVDGTAPYTRVRAAR
jgi:hypothetical protein